MRWCNLRFNWMWLIGLLMLMLASPLYSQTATLKGKVIDSATGEVLPGANVVVTAIGTSAQPTGAAAGEDGAYIVTRLAAGNYMVVASFIGYARKEFSSINLTAGETRELDIALDATGISVNAISISASRRPEKTLEAPASITVLSSSEMRGEVAPTAASVLKNTVGVDISQTGIDRREMVLRGFNNAFSGATYILTDYRQAAVPSLAVNIHSIMPNMVVDLDKVEIVRGPGSALYGAGVDAGVIHYITKDPFSHPGTSISVNGGERSFFSGAFRHAGVAGENIGYKLTGQYGQANDWELDPNDKLDAEQLANDADGLQRNYDYKKINVNGMLQFRLNDNTTLTADGGFSALDAVVLTGIGTVQADGFGYKYGQLRLQSGGFFAQAYLNNNDGGNSFVYGTDSTVVDNSNQINFQAQYDMDISDSQQLIVGVDYDRTTPDTKGTVYGRNEDNDLISETGLYAQSLTRLSPMLDLTLALRGDYNNIYEDFVLSPRVALVVKPSSQHSFRATYNYAYSSPGNNSLFLDIVAREPDASLPIRIRGRGAAYGYTFQRNSAFGAFANSDLVARSLNPATPGAAQPIGLPLDAVYNSVFASLNAIPNATIKQLLGLPSATPDALIEQVKALFAPGVTNVNGFSQGALALLNSTTGTTNPVSDVVNIDPLQQTTSQTFEFGYKGLIDNRLLMAVDFYYTSKKNFVGPVLIETPFVLVPTLAQDFQAALAAGITNNAQLAATLAAVGQTPEAVAATITQLASGSLPSPSTPVAIVVPNENDLGAGQIPELLGTYKNFGKVNFWGIDAAFQYYASPSLRLFGNMSVVSDDFFDNTELDETSTDITLALNAPKFKAKGGFNYNMLNSFSFGASGRFVKGFPVQSGPYIGEIDDYFLLDVNIGYDLSNYYQGLRFDLAFNNLLNKEHREFIGAPKLGRMIMGQLNLNF
ncbi:MAG: TonB-dependent receptor [Deferribacteres bacterium]|nr:TonB-dependent receptor [Deferribacteres bacterium]